MQAKIAKGRFVSYAVHSGRVRAIVRTVHRDGTVTVEARHFLKANGETVPGYLGYRYRYSATELTLEPTAAEARAVADKAAELMQTLASLGRPADCH